MRKFCVFICISLLISMNHAVATPLQTQQASSQALMADHKDHACNHEVGTTQAKTCYLNGHLCCLGITTALLTTIDTYLYGSELFNPVFQTLALHAHPNKQFKPPRFFSS